jgi:hypothetical protein
MLSARRHGLLLRRALFQAIKQQFRGLNCGERSTQGIEF